MRFCRIVYLATICTTSSSLTRWLRPTLWLCRLYFPLLPHTIAYLNVSFNVRWIWSHTSSIVELLRTMRASLKSGSSPFLSGPSAQR